MEAELPLNSVHPGYLRLTPSERKEYLDLLKRDVFYDNGLSPREKKRLKELLKLMKGERDLDENHAGFKHLNPEQ